jgi:hypothetical protein
MLIHIVSLNFQIITPLTIYNQYPDIELASPVLFCNSECDHEYYVERVNNGTVMEVEFKLDFEYDTLEGILMYKVQRKSTAISDHQYGKVIEEASKVIRFLVAWKIESCRVCEEKIILIEYDDKFDMSENRLAQLYEKVKNIPASYYENVWLICDNTVLKSTCDLSIHKTDFELKTYISEGIKGRHTLKPMWIDPERQVSFLMIIYLY